MSLSPVRTIALIAFALVVVRPVTGRAFSLPVAVAVEASGDLVVVDEGLAAVFRVDPATGTSTIISGAGTGAGPAFSSPFGVATITSRGSGSRRGGRG